MLEDPVTDPLQSKRWPVACVLMGIRAASSNWSVEQRQKQIRMAYHDEARAFPIDAPPLKEAQVLIDLAVASPDRIAIYCAKGQVGRQHLGPDAALLPTIDQSSGRHTFGL
jgi:hypothetical protein